MIVVLVVLVLAGATGGVNVVLILALAEIANARAKMMNFVIGEVKFLK